MPYSETSSRVGYDKGMEEHAKELDELALRLPLQLRRKMQNRIHEGIMHRLKERATRKCITAIRDLEACVKDKFIHRAPECFPQRDIVNACFREENTEENYQKIQLQFLRGELYRLYKNRLKTRVEAFKQASPDSFLPETKVAMYGDQTYEGPRTALDGEQYRKSFESLLQTLKESKVETSTRSHA